MHIAGIISNRINQRRGGHTNTQFCHHDCYSCDSSQDWFSLKTQLNQLYGIIWYDQTVLLVCAQIMRTQYIETAYFKQDSDFGRSKYIHATAWKSNL